MATIVRAFNAVKGTFPDRTVFTGVTVTKEADTNLITVTGTINQIIPGGSRIKTVDDDADFDYLEIHEVSLDRGTIYLKEATDYAFTDVPLIVLMNGAYHQATLSQAEGSGSFNLNPHAAAGSDGVEIFAGSTVLTGGWPFVIDSETGDSNVALVAE